MALEPKRLHAIIGTRFTPRDELKDSSGRLEVERDRSAIHHGAAFEQPEANSLIFWGVIIMVWIKIQCPA